jgi:hypothetical protein
MKNIGQVQDYASTKYVHYHLCSGLTGPGNVPDDAKCLGGLVPDQRPHDRLPIPLKIEN